jgi:hypothetical protein
MKKFFALLCAVLMVVAFSGVAKAAYVEVNSGSFLFYGSGIGTGRAQLFKANETFSVAGVGIYGGIPSGTYEVVIYSSDGQSAGGGLGKSWNDISVSFTFTQDSFYVVNWRLPSGGWIDGSLDYYDNAALPKTIGPLTLLTGFSGAGANDGNAYDANFRYEISAVPVPPSLLLLAPGLVGLAAVRRRFKK